jgi:hypothetical protein
MRVFCAALLLISGARAVRLTDSRLDAVSNVLDTIARNSWENGTKAQAILESDYSSMSVFSPTNPFPPSGDYSQIIDIATTTLRNRPTVNLTANGGRSLLDDAAAGDPPSLGVAVLMANASTNNGQVNGEGYGDAATQQLRYLLYDVPRVSAAVFGCVILLIPDSTRRDQSSS